VVGIISGRFGRNICRVYDPRLNYTLGFTPEYRNAIDEIDEIQEISMLDSRLGKSAFVVGRVGLKLIEETTISGVKIKNFLSNLIYLKNEYIKKN